MTYWRKMLLDIPYYRLLLQTLNTMGSPSTRPLISVFTERSRVRYMLLLRSAYAGLIMGGGSGFAD